MIFLNYITEGQHNPNWRGCLMVSIPKVEARIVKEFCKNEIHEHNLANDGREDYVHVTVLYGFSQGTDISKVAEIVKEHDAIDLIFGKISRFKADKNRPDSDVIKIEIQSLALESLHKRLKAEFNVETSYPDFNPHCTLAYVKPGTCLGLDGVNPLTGIKVRCTETTYSTGDSENRKKSIISFNDIKRKQA